MTTTMQRREFITLLGGAAAAWPLAAIAQQRTAIPVIGWLSSRNAETDASLLPAFRRGLSVYGLVEGRNVVTEYRFANGNYGQLTTLADDLISRQPSVIVSPGAGAVTTQLLHNIRTNVPVVFITGADPVKIGLVPSLNRPGNNITGVTTVFRELAPKRLGLLHELLPQVTTITILVNALNPGSDEETTLLQQSAHNLGMELKFLHTTGTADGIDHAFASMAQTPPQALLVTNDPFFFTRANQLAILTARHAIPTLYFRREFVSAGGLMSYGSVGDDNYRVAGEYTGRILKGEKASDLPVQQPTRFELAINVRTAKALNLSVPDKLLALADAVIE